MIYLNPLTSGNQISRIKAIYLGSNTGVPVELTSVYAGSSAGIPQLLYSKSTHEFTWCEGNVIDDAGIATVTIDYHSSNGWVYGETLSGAWTNLNNAEICKTCPITIHVTGASQGWTIDGETIYSDSYTFTPSDSEPIMIDICILGSEESGGGDEPDSPEYFTVNISNSSGEDYTIGYTNMYGNYTTTTQYSGDSYIYVQPGTEVLVTSTTGNIWISPVGSNSYYITQKQQFASTINYDETIEIMAGIPVQIDDNQSWIDSDSIPVTYYDGKDKEINTYLYDGTIYVNPEQPITFGDGDYNEGLWVTCSPTLNAEDENHTPIIHYGININSAGASVPMSATVTIGDNQYLTQDILKITVSDYNGGAILICPECNSELNSNNTYQDDGWGCCGWGDTIDVSICNNCGSHICISDPSNLHLNRNYYYPHGECPLCGTAMTLIHNTCPDCGNEYDYAQCSSDTCGYYEEGDDRCPECR